LPGILSGEGVRTTGFHSNTALYYNCGRIPGFDEYEDYMQELDERSEYLSSVDKATDKLRSYLDSTLTESSRTRQWLSSVADYLRDSGVMSTHETTVYIDAEKITTDVIEWVRNHRESNFFLWVHYMEPHRPYGVGRTTQEFSDRTESDAEKKRLIAKANQHPNQITEAEREYLIDLYDSDIRYLSSKIDRLIDSLHDFGIWDETTIVFTSDHGEEFDDHGVFDHRNRPYEELIHVPLVINAADGLKDRFQGAIQTEGFAELVDLYPTICEIHDIESPEALHGTSLFNGATATVSGTGSLRDNDFAVMYRNDKFKYICLTGGQDELFNLQDDPHELHSLTDERPEIAEELRQQIPHQLIDEVRKWDSEQYGDDAPTERLKDLGYLE
jgi:arylsulfatase A-like enzyme